MNPVIPITMHPMDIMQLKKLDEPMMLHKKYVQVRANLQAIYNRKINEQHVVVECEIFFVLRNK